MGNDLRSGPEVDPPASLDSRQGVFNSRHSDPFEKHVIRREALAALFGFVPGGYVVVQTGILLDDFVPQGKVMRVAHKGLRDPIGVFLVVGGNMDLGFEEHHFGQRVQKNPVGRDGACNAGVSARDRDAG